MYIHNLYLKVSVIALAITTDDIFNNATRFCTTRIQPKRDATCMDDRLHTRNFCDGYFIGNGDCENNNAVGQGILMPTQRIGEEVISRAILMVDVRPPNWG